jgi:hypothetical protein
MEGDSSQGQRRQLGQYRMNLRGGKRKGIGQVRYLRKQRGRKMPSLNARAMGCGARGAIENCKSASTAAEVQRPPVLNIGAAPLFHFCSRWSHAFGGESKLTHHPRLLQGLRVGRRRFTGVLAAQAQTDSFAIQVASGNISEAARALGVHPNYLHRLVTKLGLRNQLSR